MPPAPHPSSIGVALPPAEPRRLEFARRLDRAHSYRGRRTTTDVPPPSSSSPRLPRGLSTAPASSSTARRERSEDVIPPTWGSAQKRDCCSLGHAGVAASARVTLVRDVRCDSALGWIEAPACPRVATRPRQASSARPPGTRRTLCRVLRTSRRRAPSADRPEPYARIPRVAGHRPRDRSSTCRVPSSDAPPPREPPSPEQCDFTAQPSQLSYRTPPCVVRGRLLGRLTPAACDSAIADFNCSAAWRNSK
jgi:hypothetical protein